jgi:hypothetical protein
LPPPSDPAAAEAAIKQLVAGLETVPVATWRKAVNDARLPLSKRRFLGLKTGDYLVSNCGFPPIFAETILFESEREDQWKRIVASGANGKRFALFASVEDYENSARCRLPQKIT